MAHQVQLWIILLKDLKETEIKNSLIFFQLLKHLAEKQDHSYTEYWTEVLSLLKKFEILREQTELLSRKIGSFINYLKNTELKGAKFK